MKLYFILLFLFLVSCVCKNNIIEGNLNETQFYSCSDSRYKIDGLDPPPTNYKKRLSEISDPLRGTYTYFIDSNNLRNEDQYHRTPICSDSYLFKDNYTDQFIDIIDNKDEIMNNKTNILDREEKYFDKHVNPFEEYRDVSHFEDTLIYSDDIVKKFLYQKEISDEK